MQDEEIHLLFPQPLKEGIFQILIGIDNQNNIEILKDTLLTHNYKITVVNTSDEVLLHTKEKEFDLLILDLNNSKITGFDVCRILREQHSIFELPILILAGRKKNIVQSFSCGANDYLSKPFNKNELLARANTLLTLKLAVKNAISNARALESEKQHRLFAETLSDLTRTLTSTLDMNDVLKKFLEYLDDYVPFDRSIILIKENEKFKIKINSGFELINLNYVNNFADFLADEINNNGVYINNDFEQELIFKELDIPGSILSIPILLRNEIFGVIILVSDKKNNFCENEIGMVFSFAGQAGIAIENARLFEEVKKLATIDGLTKLYNRRYFYELAEREFEEAKKSEKPLSAIMVDIDNFKKINDNFGHNIGDDFIKFVAQKSSKAIRKTDIISRYGGEEFVILLPSTDINTAIIIAERIRKSIAEESLLTRNYGDLFVTASFGVSTNGFDVSDLEQLLIRVDSALYKAKQDGRNRVVSI